MLGEGNKGATPDTVMDSDKALAVWDPSQKMCVIQLEHRVSWERTISR